MIARKRFLVAVIATLLGLSGCCSHKEKCSYCPPPPGTCPRPGPVVVPAAPAPVVPTYQPIPAVQPALVPANPNAVRAAPPVLQPADPVTPDVRLTQPQIVEAPRRLPEAPAAAIAPKIGTAGEPGDSPSSPPLDIPAFALAKTKVATGQKPFPDGIAWLQTQGYRTALYLKTPETNDREVRQQFESKGIRYLTLEVAPGALTREMVEAFSQMVNDSSNYPVFVFDNDGALTGGLWLLHFRLVEGISDEKARLEAARLGFRQNQPGNHQAMAEAVSRYLQAQIP